MDEIATRPLEKTHRPYSLSAARLEHWSALFLEPSYEVTALPSDDRETAANSEASFVSVVGEDGSVVHFSVLRDSAHTNVAELFHEEERRIEEEDALTVVPGFLGAYPHALFEVKRSELDAFVAAVEALGSERFWPHSDRVERDHRARDGLAAGLFDYSRLEGY
jgi:hypothetical protein